LKKIIKEIFFNNIGLTCNFAELIMSFYPIRQHYTNYFVPFQRKTSYFFENFLELPFFQAKRPLSHENTRRNFAVFISYLVLLPRILCGLALGRAVGDDDVRLARGASVAFGGRIPPPRVAPIWMAECFMERAGL